MALYQGLQIQMLVRPYIDVLVEYDRAVRTLRRGWQEREVPAWDLEDSQATVVPMRPAVTVLSSSARVAQTSA